MAVVLVDERVRLKLDVQEVEACDDGDDDDDSSAFDCHCQSCVRAVSFDPNV